MGFVNEYVSDEDIEKYDLHGIWDRYYPLYKGEFFFGNSPHWTVDKENNTFLTTIDPGGKDRGNRRRFLLWIDGAHVVAELALAEGSSGDLDADPFMRVWDLVEINLPESKKSKEAQVTGSLKDALRVYGYWGIWKQLANTIVEFKF